MQRLVDAEKLTPSGRDWLIANLDPYHDTQLENLHGWPDLQSSASVVICHQAAAQLSIPGGGVGNWDANIQLNPLMNNRAFSGFARNDDLFGIQNGLSQNVGLLTIRSYSGAAADGNYTLSDVVSANQSLGVPGSYLEGRGRLIGVGFEITNTTAELYKSGTLTCYRVPQDGHRQTRRLTTTGASPAALAITCQPVCWSPDSLTAALLMEGTKQWKAADGAYVVGSFNGIENPVQQVEYCQPVLVPSTSHESTIVLPNTFAEMVTLPENALTSDRLCYWQPNKFAPINSSGVFLTGLSEQSTFTITIKCFYEQFPSPSEPLYAVLARPSACFDPLALQMMLHASQTMPVGVPVADNGFGDWFAGLISDFAPMIGSALSVAGVPGAAAMGTGAKFLADRYLDTSPSKTARKVRPYVRPQPKRQPDTNKTNPVRNKPPPTKPKKKKKKKAPPGYEHVRINGQDVLIAKEGW